MFRLSKLFRFEASHCLNQHDGKCAQLHGHSWKMRVTVDGVVINQTGPKTGMLIDFRDLKALVQPIIDDCLDHHHLNDTLDVYPTSENIAQWVFEELQNRISQCYTNLRLVEVAVQETETSEAAFFLLPEEG